MRDAQSLLERLLASGGPAADGRAGPRPARHGQRRAGARRARRPGRPRRRRGAPAPRRGGRRGGPADRPAGRPARIPPRRDGAGGRVRGRPCWPPRPRQQPRLQALVERWPLDSVLAALQILDATRARLRGSPHGRLLVEMALVRIARLENLNEISDLVARLAALEAGLPPPAAHPGTGGGRRGKKKADAPPPPATRAARGRHPVGT